MSRAQCPRCQRPQADCICRWVLPIDNQVELLLLQHPLEQQHSKGTAGLLRLSLARCRLQVGEHFDEQALLGTTAGATLLLYPQDAGEAALEISALVAAPQRLIVLDATWRKSRKLLHLNPWLQRLPRLALQQPPASRYLIRKAQQAHQLSTLEASVLALQQLEGCGPERYAPLLAAFEGFISQQQGWLSRANPPPESLR